MKASSKLLLVASVGALLTLAVGMSWACTVAAGVAVSQNSGPAGVSVTITGKTFAPGPVEIRWNSSEGPVIATAQGPDFSVQAVPPVGVRPDVYYLVAIQTGPQGTFKASETFEVTGAAGGSFTASSADGWSGFSSKGSTPSSLAETPVTSDGSIPAGGVGLLAVGLAGLATAAIVPAVRSMKARASVRS